jgi:2-octaprenyl-6-methoxyphenol hydroxylase
MEPIVDVIISGGGLVGGTLSVALAQAGVKVLVIDRETQDSLLDPKLDGRTTAVAYGSQQMFFSLGMWGDIKKGAEPILRIKAYEAQSPWHISYDYRDVGEKPLGYIADNRTLRQGIFKRVNDFSENIIWKAPHVMDSFERSPYGVTVNVAGETYKAPLLVVAEGRQSPTRDQVGIQVKKLSYNQTALVFWIRHTTPHEGCAWEIFYPKGPLAVLPMPVCPETGLARSGIVWMVPSAEAADYLALETKTLSEKFSSLFPHYKNIEVVGKIWSYPLSAQIAERLIDSRVALVGDAAHGIHPVAGQGVNIGWRDVAALAEVVVDAKRMGLDLGSETVLTRYQRWRRFDNLATLGMSDSMVRLFSNNSTILHFLRNAGLGIVNQISPLKRLLMKQAMGIAGTPPRLIRGGAL